MIHDMSQENNRNIHQFKTRFIIDWDSSQFTPHHTATIEINNNSNNNDFFPLSFTLSTLSLSVLFPKKEYSHIEKKEDKITTSDDNNIYQGDDDLLSVVMIHEQTNKQQQH